MQLLRACVFLSLSGVSTSFLPAAVQPPSSARAAPQRLQATTPAVVGSDAEAFERITLARRATKHFDRRAVPEDVLKKVMPCFAIGTIPDRSKATTSPFVDCRVVAMQIANGAHRGVFLFFRRAEEQARTSSGRFIQQESRAVWCKLHFVATCFSSAQHQQ